MVLPCVFLLLLLLLLLLLRRSPLLRPLTLLRLLWSTSTSKCSVRSVFLGVHLVVAVVFVLVCCSVECAVLWCSITTTTTTVTLYLFLYYTTQLLWYFRIVESLVTIMTIGELRLWLPYVQYSKWKLIGPNRLTATGCEHLYRIEAVYRCMFNVQYDGKSKK